jgi:hypothetical protein
MMKASFHSKVRSIRDASTRKCREIDSRPHPDPLPGERAGVPSNLKLETSNSSERGVALVITLILLSVITFMAIAFLVISRHASEAVTSVTQQAIAKQAANDAVQQVEAGVIATMLANNEGFDFGPMVSQNYQSPAFTNGVVANVANVNYSNCVDINGNPAPYTGTAYLQMLNNLMVLSRPPVFITTNAGFPLDFRFYLDLNRNGMFDPTTLNGQTLFVTNQFNQREPVTAGDPEWIGVLEHPDQPHSRSNFYTARYAFFAQPIGNSLDINFIHNQVKHLGVAQDGFLRNQGVGSWEINLAGFLNGLNPNYWTYGNGLPGAGYDGLDINTPPGSTYNSSSGSAFQDAAFILQYRYNGTYLFNNLLSMGQMYPGSVNLFLPPNNNVIDYYSMGPLTGVSAPALFEFANTQAWSGAGNPVHLFTSQDFFSPALPALSPVFSFTNRLALAGQGLPVPVLPATFPDINFHRYTYYRMLAQMGMESAPEPDTKLNLNYKNVDGFQASNFVTWAEDTNRGDFASASDYAVNLTNAVVFFTNAANRLLGTQTNCIIPLPWGVTVPGTGFVLGLPTNMSTGFIPVYPNNYYTPSVHRMLQLAANIYDAANPKVVGNTNTYFDYPSVFRPVFGAQFTGNLTEPYLWIKGYVEVTNTDTNTADYNFPAYSLSLPADRSNMFVNINRGSNNFNVYEVPWVIGAKKGLPNFNQISLESFTQLTRKLQITKPSLKADLTTFHTNVQYILSVSNALMAEAWNSYVSAYPRAVDIGGIDTLTMTLTNEFGVITPAAFYSTNLSLLLQLTPQPAAGTWAGVGANLTSNIAGSFRIPLLASTIFLPGGIYSTNTIHSGTFLNLPNPFNQGFENTIGYPVPRFGLILTNRLRFVMTDHATGRVIDYVQLNGMGGQRDLTGAGELEGNDAWGHGGAWDTNRLITGSSNPKDQLWAIENQISASLQMPPYTSSNPNDSSPLGSNDWENAATQAEGYSSVGAAVSAFQSFYYGEHLTATSPLQIQVPYTPTRTVCVYYTWQANDPLVHYTLPDLTDLIDSTNGVQTNWVITNNILGNIGQINQRYMPWGGSVNGGNGDYNNNMTLKDPLVTKSDDWQFPHYKIPNIGWLGHVHRGTPWQTVYMKSQPVDPTLWQNWTGNAILRPAPNLANRTSDSFYSQPTNDWEIFDLFTTAPNDNATRGQLSVNQPNFADWAAVLDGVSVLTNDPVNGLTNVLIDPNATNGALYTIYSSITNVRANSPGGVFTRVGDILAAPALSITSPFLNIAGPNSATQLNDAAYERLPQQIMSLLRVGQPRYVIYAYGQALKPANRSVVPSGQFYGTCTNYQITGEVVTRTVVRFEPATALDSTNIYTPLNPTQNPVMPLMFAPPNAPLILPPRPQMRAVVESFTVLPPE